MQIGIEAENAIGDMETANQELIDCLELIIVLMWRRTYGSRVEKLLATLSAVIDPLPLQ